MSDALDNIKTEINAHPKERLGFSKADILALPPAEKSIAISLLIAAIAEGDERCDEPLQWLTQGQYLTTLENALMQLLPSDHGYFYLSYFAYLETRDSVFMTKMKDAILQGDKHWDMRRSALGRNIKNIMPAKDYAEFCKVVALSDSNPHVIKTALLSILEYKQIDTNNYRLLPQHQNLLAMLTSADAAAHQLAQVELNKILS